MGEAVEAAVRFPTSVNQSVYKYLASSTGNIQVTTTATSTSVNIFSLQPSTSETYRIQRMIVHARDTGGFDAEKYGNNITFTNGLLVRVQDDSGTVLDLLDGQPIIANGQWSRVCHEVDVKTWGVGDEMLTARWTFAKAGFPVRLEGAKNERLEVVLQDSATGLTNSF